MREIGIETEEMIIIEKDQGAGVGTDTIEIQRLGIKNLLVTDLMSRKTMIRPIDVMYPRNRQG
jgi:hypothetical protein